MTASKPPPPGEKAKQGLARYRDTVATAKRRDIDKALRDLRKANAAITVAAVAARSGVSRKTIYKHRDVIATIDQYRQHPPEAAHTESGEVGVVGALRRTLAAREKSLAEKNQRIREPQQQVSEQADTIAMLYGKLDGLGNR